METQPQSPVDVHSCDTAGCYVYCVVPCCLDVRLSVPGIEGHQVYLLSHHDLGAVVHDCPARPYYSENSDLVASWVMAHHRVVHTAWERWGTALPLTFNTVVKGSSQMRAAETVMRWLENENDSLRIRLASLAGKAEYGVQVFWDTERIVRGIAESSGEIRNLRSEIESKPRGMAYMYRQRLENLLRRALEARAESEFKSLYARTSQCVSNVRADRVKGDDAGRQMLANLSCLVCRDRFPDLQAELDRINKTEGFSVRLVGPLPPYTFC